MSRNDQIFRICTAGIAADSIRCLFIANSHYNCRGEPYSSSLQWFDLFSELLFTESHPKAACQAQRGDHQQNHPQQQRRSIPCLRHSILYSRGLRRYRGLRCCGRLRRCRGFRLCRTCRIFGSRCRRGWVDGASRLLVNAATAVPSFEIVPAAPLAVTV